MQAGDSATSILPASPEPFALIVGRFPADAETAFRRMGLRPEAIAGAESDARMAPPRFRLRLASVSVLAARAGDEALDVADPRHPSTSLLAASLPPGWRGNACWLFTPEADGDRAAETARLREFFKMMVLLIDLAEASHIFWSPARLWSDAPQFRGAVAEMLTSGMPPVLHLVAFRHRETGDGAVVRTRGLAQFGGQELEGRMPGGWTVAEMVKRLARLALDIMLNGPVAAPQRLKGLGAGEWISLNPPPDGVPGASVRVEFGSDYR